MKVYIEYVIIDNLIINILLLSLTNKILGMTIKRPLIILSSGFGTAVAVILPLVNLSNFASIVVKISLAILMTITATNYNTKKQYFKGLALFFSLTAIYGGGMLAIFSFFEIDFLSKNSSTYLTGIPLAIICSLGLIFYKIIFAIYKSMTHKKHIENYIRQCEIHIGDCKFCAVGFIDTGNRLYFNNGTIPIILASKSLSLQIKSVPIIAKYFNSNLQCNTVSSSTTLPLYKVKKIVIISKDKRNIIYNVMLALTENAFNQQENFDIILHPAIS